MLLGVHCSISGGLRNAFHEARSLGITTFQIFTKNQRQWKEKVVEPAEALQFRSDFEDSGVKTAFSHASYLINLASNEDGLWLRSTEALIGEVRRCDLLGLAFIVLHPGAAKGSGEQEGIERVVKALKAVLQATGDSSVKILLENTAGQGTSIGHTFEHLRQIMDGVDSGRICLCFDTCHAFAAGYDIRTKSGFEATMERLDRTVGLQHLMAIHLNDSKGDLGSNRDRHEHIGKGKIGVEPFRQIMKQFQHTVKVIETPKEDRMDEVNLRVLRELV